MSYNNMVYIKRMQDGRSGEEKTYEYRELPKHPATG
jgi:hypothetical protein